MEGCTRTERERAAILALRSRARRARAGDAATGRILDGSTTWIPSSVRARLRPDLSSSSPSTHRGPRNQGGDLPPTLRTNHREALAGPHSPDDPGRVCRRDYDHEHRARRYTGEAAMAEGGAGLMPTARRYAREARLPPPAADERRVTRLWAVTSRCRPGRGDRGLTCGTLCDNEPLRAAGVARSEWGLRGARSRSVPARTSHPGARAPPAGARTINELGTSPAPAGGLSGDQDLETAGTPTRVAPGRASRSWNQGLVGTGTSRGGRAEEGSIGGISEASSVGRERGSGDDAAKRWLSLRSGLGAGGVSSSWASRHERRTQRST